MFDCRLIINTTHINLGQMPPSSSRANNNDDDFGEEVYTGQVKAARLPQGGPASRMTKKEVQGGKIAQGELTPMILPGYQTSDSASSLNFHHWSLLALLVAPASN